MSSHILKHKIGLPVWDGDFVRDIKIKQPGETITKAELHEAGQDDEEQAMLIEHNCYTDEELDELRKQEEEAA